METSLLSRYLAIPFLYKAHPAINENRFYQCDWMEFHREAEEAIPGNIPVSIGNFILTHCFIDANYTGDTDTRRYQTGILLFCNSAPIICFRKMGNSVEA